MTEQNPDRFLGASGDQQPDGETQIDQPGLTDSAVASQLQTVLDLDQILSAARSVERTVYICLNGPLLAEYGEVIAQLADVLDADGNVVGDEEDQDSFLGLVNQAKQLATRERTLHKQIVRERVPFRFRALPSDEWEQLLKTHRDNQGNVKDQSKLEDAVIARSAASPSIDAAGMTRLRGAVNQAQLVALWNGAWYVNTRDGVDIPFSPNSSLVLKQ